MLDFSFFWIVALVGLIAIGVLAWIYRGAIKELCDRTFSANPFRMVLCGLAAIVFLAVVAFISPVQLPVTIYKIALVLLSGYLGYWLDVWLFPYSRPDGYLCRNWKNYQGFKESEPDHAIVPGYEMVFAAALTRRAIIVGMCMLAVGLGL